MSGIRINIIYKIASCSVVFLILLIYAIFQSRIDNRLVISSYVMYKISSIPKRWTH